MSKSRDLRYENIYQSFKDLFDKAKAKDEFEYCCALLRIRGSEGPGWDIVQESNTLLTQILLFVNAPINHGFQVRLLLLAYCHALEMNFTYDMVANMLQISQGERYCTNWFDAEIISAKKSAIYPIEKIEKIEQWAQSFNQKEIGEILREMLLKDIRNTFAHSDYILYGDELRIVQMGELPKVHKLQELIPKLEFGINIVLMLIALTRERILSYKENKRVFSRLSENDTFFDMELVADPNFGLSGFRNVPKIKIERKNNLCRRQGGLHPTL